MIDEIKNLIACLSFGETFLFTLILLMVLFVIVSLFIFAFVPMIITLSILILVGMIATVIKFWAEK